MGLNPNARIAKSSGIDLPVMYVYLAGRIAGNCMDKCVGWRQKIVEHYKNYKVIQREAASSPNYIGEKPKILSGEADYYSYPIAFLDPLNSGESKTADKLGLTSHIPANLIYDKDLLSVNRADVVVANVEDYFEVGIENYLTEKSLPDNVFDKDQWYKEAFLALKDKILNRRENFGTICEIAWALYLQKPLILIVPEARKEIYMKHPFARRASVIVTSVEQLLEEKHLNTLYKSIAGATY